MRNMLVDGIRMAIRVPVRILRSLSSSNNRPKPSDTTASPETRSGFLQKVIGWPPAKSDASRETAWLDGLRGIAAFLVMALHFNMRYFPMYLEAPYGGVLLFMDNTTTYALWRLPFFRFFFTSGHAQVSVFFVLSGFVLSWSSLEHIRTGNTERLLNTLSSATLRRWFRLYFPCFIAAVLGFIRLRMSIDIPANMERYDSIFYQAWDYILACESFARPILRNREFPNWLHNYNWNMWSIPLEFEGSLLVFVLLLSMAKVRQYRTRCLILLVWAIYACVLAHWSYWLFVSGMLLADFVKEAGGFARLTQKVTGIRKMACWCVFTLGLWMAGVPETSPNFYTRPGYDFLERFVPHSYDNMESGNRFWWSLAGILLVYSACGLKPVRRLCETRPALYLGQISYMLYLTHSGFPMDISYYIAGRYKVSAGTPYWLPSVGVNVYVLPVVSDIILYCLIWMVMIVTSIPLAYWCYVLMDKTSVTAAKRIEMWLTESSSTVSQSEASAKQTRDRENDGREHERIALLPV